MNPHLSPVPPPGDDPDAAALIRMVDANANRMLEGLRVLEDLARFALNDRHLTQQLKNLRHDLASCIDQLDWGHRWRSRETLTDVGAEISTATEHARENLRELLVANLRRSQQAARTLEEAFKALRREPAAHRLEQARYQLYTLEKSLGIAQEQAAQWARVYLYAIVDGMETSRQFAARVEAMLAGGVDAIQLRDKTLADRNLLQRAQVLRELTIQYQALLVINDRPDLAALVRADGVHLGQDDLDVASARRIVGPQARIGVSTHTIEQARRAVLDGADYLGVGPVFPSTSKEFSRFPGLEFVSQVAQEISLPAFAIGGIRADNVQQVVDAGIRRIAVAAAVAHSDDPAAAARQLRQLLLQDESAPLSP